MQPTSGRGPVRRWRDAASARRGRSPQQSSAEPLSSTPADSSFSDSAALPSDVPLASSSGAGFQPAFGTDAPAGTASAPTSGVAVGPVRNVASGKDSGGSSLTIGLVCLVLLVAGLGSWVFAGSRAGAAG